MVIAGTVRICYNYLNLVTQLLSSWQSNLPSIYRPGTIGRDLPGFHTRLDKDAPGVSDISPGAGELCMRGRNVFMGYLGAEERTREVFDTDGWHHSGDVGTADEDGYFTITGRIKEILITAGGENVPPVIIEDMVSCCRNCVVIVIKYCVTPIILPPCFSHWIQSNNLDTKTTFMRLKT